MVTTRTSWREALDSLYDAIEALDVDGYRLASSDGWARARRIVSPQNGSGHLEVWAGLGPIAEVHRAHLVLEGVVSFLFRYQADDDGHSQASMCAAQASLVELLTVWRGPRGARSIPTGTEIRGPSGEWLLVDVFFNLWMPR